MSNRLSSSKIPGLILNQLMKTIEKHEKKAKIQISVVRDIIKARL